MSLEASPTLVLVPCFSGAAWSLDQREAFTPLPIRAITLPEDLDDLESYADAVAARVANLDHYVLVGDSFGAAVALTLAVRQPQGLVGLVLSGGFASDPLTTMVSRVGSHTARWMPGVFYRQVTLRIHAFLLRSPFDTGPGVEVRWPQSASRRLFVRATSWSSYTSRVRAARSGDARDRLGRVRVPTLVLAPSYDHLVGEKATAVLSNSIPGAEHVVLADTGHMFRFTHPRRYGAAVRVFLERAELIDTLPMAS
jgi:pimeloyl-ACP methyl ester carboxylesterase